MRDEMEHGPRALTVRCLVIMVELMALENFSSKALCGASLTHVPGSKSSTISGRKHVNAIRCGETIVSSFNFFPKISSPMIIFTGQQIAQIEWTERNKLHSISPLSEFGPASASSTSTRSPIAAGASNHTLWSHGDLPSHWPGWRPVRSTNTLQVLPTLA